ncbi:MAG TPA: flagellar hook-length control protein FliK [Clostridium sp.]|uniref:flagellar hook-length control protein FliK n=1 Tax=Clostridium sp. TaxID=1506 RepID=UPI002F930AF7
MNVSNNVITYPTPTKIDIPKQPDRKEEFKKALDDQTLQSSNSSNDDVDKTNNKNENLDEAKSENLDKANNEYQSDDVGKTKVEGGTSKSLDESDTGDKVNTEKNNDIEESIKELKQNIDKLPKDLASKDSKKIVDALKKIIDVLKQNVKKSSGKLESKDKSTDEMAKMQQLLQSLTFMVQSINKTPVTKTSETEINSINTEQLKVGEQLTSGEKLTSDEKGTLKNNLNEIVSLMEKQKENNKVSSEILGVLQKLTTEVKEGQSDLNLKGPILQTGSQNSEDKSIKDNLIKMVIKQSTKTTSESISKNQMQSSTDSKKDNKSSGSSNFDEKFLNKLLGGDKDDVKISKVVNFMNQFQEVKTSYTTKVQNTNLVINKNNFEVDVIKSIKFMDLNNIKNLTVKMNPKELGEITIKLTMESGIMKASILAQNKETYNLLNQNIQDVQDRLKNMDIKIQNLDINVYEDSTFFNKNPNENNNSNGKQNNNSKTNIVIDDDVAISNNYVIEDNQVNKFV